MTVHQIEHYSSDPEYQAAMRHLQQGEWEEGLRMFHSVMTRYPLIHELRGMYQEMQLRSRLDQDEAEDDRRSLWQGVRKASVRLLTIALIAVLLYWAFQTYSTWIQGQFQTAQTAVEAQVKTVQLAASFRNAQDLAAAGRLQEAQALFAQVQAIDAQYPGLEVAMQHNDLMIKVETQYQEALLKIQHGDLQGGQAALSEIAAEQPYYKDVSILMKDVENRIALDGSFNMASAAYETERWSDAITAFEALRLQDPSFMASQVEEKLYSSYLNAAKAALASPAATIDDLEAAESYYQKALMLRPQDSAVRAEQTSARASISDRLFNSYIQAAQKALAESASNLNALQTAQEYLLKAYDIRPDDATVALQMQMSKDYLAALQEFNKGNYSDAIGSLEDIYAEDHEYAGGAARQTLYDAYLARGDAAMAKGEYEAALSDYQQAAVLANDSPEAILRLYETQVKVATLQGILGNYESASLIFRAVIELSDFRAKAANDQPEIVAKLDQAEASFTAGNFRVAYRLYNEAIAGDTTVYTTITHVVKEGEYLSMLAAQYGSSVNAIAEANNISNPNKIYVGQELIIPVIK